MSLWVLGWSVLGLSGCGTTLAAVQDWTLQCEVGSLRDGLRQDRSWIRRSAAEGLGRCRVEAARGDLEARVSDAAERRWVRAAATRALAELGVGPSLPLLVGLAADATLEPEIQLALVDALLSAASEKPDACSALSPLSGRDEPLVAARAQLALGQACGADG